MKIREIASLLGADILCPAEKNMPRLPGKRLPPPPGKSRLHRGQLRVGGKTPLLAAQQDGRLEHCAPRLGQLAQPLPNGQRLRENMVGESRPVK